jgi:hypothetical protein
MKKLPNRSKRDKTMERFMTIKKNMEIIDKLSKKLETWQIKDLKPYDRNSLAHSEEQVIRIAESIKKSGFTNPILIEVVPCLSLLENLGKVASRCFFLCF